MSPGADGPGHQAFDHVAVVAGRNEADILAVGLFGVDEPVLARELAHLGLGHLAEGKAQASELAAGGGEQEIALVPLGVGGPVERPAAAAVVARDDIMAGREEVGPQVFAAAKRSANFMCWLQATQGIGVSPPI